MRPRVPSLATCLAALPEYRTAQGKRYALVAFRVYVWVALVCGRRSQAALADWGTDDGAAVRAPVGMAGERGPRQATLQRLVKQVRRDTLAAARRRWAAAVLHAHSHADRDHRGVPACAGMASAGTPRRGSHQQGAPAAHRLRALRHRLQVGVGQGAVDATSTARTAIATRLPLVGGAGRMTTTAAWPTPRPVAQAILDAGGAYGLLGNAHQPPGLADLVRVFAHAAVLADPISEPRRTTRHGERRAARQLWTSTA